jgi:di/tricarboxylate transporter
LRGAAPHTSTPNPLAPHGPHPPTRTRAPPDNPSSKRLGEFLFMSQAQVSSATSAMFYMGGAQTPVAINLAANQGVVIASPFDTYLKGAVVPSAVLIALTPLAIYFLVAPQVKATPWARAEARARLRARGRPAWPEAVMIATLLGAVALWVSAAAARRALVAARARGPAPAGVRAAPRACLAPRPARRPLTTFGLLRLIASP